MYKKRLLLNTVTGTILQATTFICGIILPKLILAQYGSEVNGLTQSITRFLSVISFLELGVGYVIQSALYKPLADKDNDELSRIVTSGGRFFSKIGQILLIYVIVLCISFPFINHNNFGFLYTDILILAISISFFAQYFFGIIDRLLLNSDQKGYIQYTFQVFTLVLNTIITIVLIKANASIQMVKLCSSFVFLIRPLILRIYVNEHYSINRKAVFSVEPLKQKWNGVALHISATVLDDTDTIVLTLFSTLINVSIYSVYNLVVSGVKQLVLSATSGIDSAIGTMWAKKQIDKLTSFFETMEWIIHVSSVYVFSCAGILIIPFVSVYTKDIDDANYIRPLFSTILIIAHAGHCLRLPYNKMIISCGHFKETQSCYIIAAVLNIVISIISVYFCGLVGVAIGTLVAMFYQTFWMAMYNSKNLIKWPFMAFIKHLFVDFFEAAVIYLSTSWITLQKQSFLSWVIMALKVALVGGSVLIVIDILFYHKNYIKLFKYVKQKVRN